MEKIHTVGRRKKSVARLFLDKGKAQININSNDIMADLYIINIKGEKVKTIFNGKLEVGQHNFNWDSGANSSGIYFSVLETTYKIKTRKLMILLIKYHW